MRHPSTFSAFGRTTVLRLPRIILSRPAGGRKFPALIQIALIVAWHRLMIAGVSALPFEKLAEWSSHFWYRVGVTPFYVSKIETVPFTVEGRFGALLAAATLIAVPVLLEALPTT